MEGVGSVEFCRNNQHSDRESCGFVRQWGMACRRHGAPISRRIILSPSEEVFRLELDSSARVPSGITATPYLSQVHANGQPFIFVLSSAKEI